MHAGREGARSTRSRERRWPDDSAFPSPGPVATHTQELPYEIPRGRLSEIDLAISRCEYGAGALVWTGEPGMGKSALLAHAAAEAEALGSLVIRVPSQPPGLQQNGPQRSGGRQPGAERTGTQRPGAHQLDAQQPGAHQLDAQQPGAHQLDAQQPGAHQNDGDIALDYVVRRLIDDTKDLDSSRSAPVQPLIPADLRNAATHQNVATLGRSLADLITAGKHERAVVFVVDDLENLDEVTRRTLVSAVAERRAAAVLLVTATDPDLVRSLPYEIERRPLAPVTNADALFMLQESLDTTVAPHVIHVLNEHVSGAPTALVETAQTLSSAQLSGLSQLPDPLPVSPSTHRAVSPDLMGMPGRDRELLLAAAVSVSDRTDLFLAAMDLEIDELLSSSAARHLRLVAGHIKIADPRIRALVHGDASVGERTIAHQKLARAHEAAGSEITALWHHALASLTGDAALSHRLLKVAERMLELGDAAWAQRVARESLSHATGAARPEAMIVAGNAALHAGHISDAVGLLREAARILPRSEAQKVSAALTAAVTFATGQVPDEVIPNDKPDVHAQQLAAVFHSERADLDAADHLIDALAAGDRGAVVPGDVGAVARDDTDAPAPGDPEHEESRVELLRAWMEVLGGDPEPGLHAPTQASADLIFTVAARIVRALSLVRTGSGGEARRVVTSTLSELSPPSTSPWDPDFHNGSSHSVAITPLLNAYLHLADIIVEYASGNISGAKKALQQAAFTLPMALPFAGLVCVIAGRLSVLRTGEIDELATVLEKLVPVPHSPTVHTELLANRALAHVIAGEIPEAETLLEMARSSHSSTLPLLTRPNYFDIAELLGLPPASSHDMLAPDADTLTNLAITNGEADGGDALDMALRHLITGRRSAAAAASAEGADGAAKGAGSARAGSAKGAEYLTRSALLFEEIGAGAAANLARVWAGQVAKGASVTELAPPPKSPVESSFASGTSQSEDEEAEAETLPEWATLLTEREREVAQTIARGATNREAAAELFVSIRTIEVHLTSIFRKLEIGSRVELAIIVGRAPMP